MKKISFIILHYKNLKDTIECIESINKLNSKNEISIIVVDNNSLDKKEESKLKKYTKDLILLEKNQGFAKGNNAGCKYAIKKYKPDFICVINNDTIIEQNNFIEEIINCYKETKYHEKLIKIYSNVLKRNMLKIYMKIKSIFKKPLHMENGDNSEYNVALHGCALIFSKKYYEKYKDVFYNETFLYHEEEFLNYRKNKDKLITYYDSKLEIFHKEGSSLNERFKNQNYDKLIFRNKEILKSLNLLKDVMIQKKDI